MLIGGIVNISNCLNRVENHEKIEKELRDGIDFAGRQRRAERRFASPATAKAWTTTKASRTAPTGLKRVVGYAEQKKVMLIMELLNSKVDHKDYMCDRTPWGVELCKRSARRGSSCSTTSTTCRSWKAT